MDKQILVWPGGEHEFVLRLGELEALQLSTDSGPGEVMARLYASISEGNPLTGPWKISDVLDTIRLGLIGAGMDAIKARLLVQKAIARHGVPELIPTAADILLFSLSPRSDSEDGAGASGEALGE